MAIQKEHEVLNAIKTWRNHCNGNNNKERNKSMFGGGTHLTKLTSQASSSLIYTPKSKQFFWPLMKIEHDYMGY
jgi:hypothetical protein